jgi:hypothetical protein
MAKVGDLRTAYLIAFAQFGYSYALNSRLDKVRTLIQNPTASNLDYFWFSLGWDAEEANVFMLARTPFPMLFVRLGRRAVLLPWLNGPEHFYEAVEEHRRNQTRLQMSGDIFEWPSRMVLDLDFAARTAESEIN